jgi:signal peptidase I
VNKDSIKTELRQIVLLIGLLLIARSTLADHYYVPSGSMEFTLQVGDRVIVDKRAYGYRIPFTNVDIVGQDTVGRGEIVIFDSPKDGKRLIKRVVAVGGDEVTLVGGHLTVNGQVLGSSEDPPIEQFDLRSAFLNLEHGGGPDLYRLQIPQGMLLAMGDHRGRSMDGRFFGVVPESQVYGRALSVYHRKGEGFTWIRL